MIFRLLYDLIRQGTAPASLMYVLSLAITGLTSSEAGRAARGNVVAAAIPAPPHIKLRRVKVPRLFPTGEAAC
jgi:hypothetical protein